MLYFLLPVSNMITVSSTGGTVLKGIILLNRYAYILLNLGPYSYIHIVNVLSVWTVTI
jgi:hypothetical protein